jgi:hypothetical protein
MSQGLHLVTAGEFAGAGNFVILPRFSPRAFAQANADANSQFQPKATASRQAHRMEVPFPHRSKHGLVCLREHRSGNSWMPGKDRDYCELGCVAEGLLSRRAGIEDGKLTSDRSRRRRHNPMIDTATHERDIRSL